MQYICTSTVANLNSVCKIYGGVMRPAALLIFFLLMPLTTTILSANSRSAPDSFADLAQKLLPSVVNISTTSVVKNRSGSPELPQFPPGSPFEEFFREFFDRNRPPEHRRATSLGSGFIIEKSGVVITNNHVIQDADEIKVILHDNRHLK